MYEEDINKITESIRIKWNMKHACQTYTEFKLIYECIKKCQNLSGAFAEIGVYEGFTSEYIFRLKNPDRRFFVCDTFTGLADVCGEDVSLGIPNGLLAVSFERFCSINDFVSDSSVQIVQGYFPESATQEMDESKYAFVMIDADTYTSTLKSLDYFYPKMVNGGILMVHDYINHSGTAGVKKAVDTFMADKEESVITHDSSTQAIITKI